MTVHKFTGISSNDTEAAQVIAMLPELQGVVVVGWNADGDFHFASSFADGGTVLWLLEKAKKALLEVEVT